MTAVTGSVTPVMSSVARVLVQASALPVGTQQRYFCSGSVSTTTVPTSTTSTPPLAPAQSVSGGATCVGVRSPTTVSSAWRASSCKTTPARPHAPGGPSREGSAASVAMPTVLSVGARGRVCGASPPIPCWGVSVCWPVGGATSWTPPKSANLVPQTVWFVRTWATVGLVGAGPS